MEFQDDFGAQEAVFLFKWRDTGQVVRNAETEQEARDLIERIRRYKGQISGPFTTKFPTVEDRWKFLDAQIEKLEKWLRG